MESNETPLYVITSLAVSCDDVFNFFSQYDYLKTWVYRHFFLNNFSFTLKTIFGYFVMYFFRWHKLLPYLPTSTSIVSTSFFDTFRCFCKFFMLYSTRLNSAFNLISVAGATIIIILTSSLSLFEAFSFLLKLVKKWSWSSCYKFRKQFCLYVG